MQIVVNYIGKGENVIEVLDTMSKGRVLKTIQNTLVHSNCVLALACNLSDLNTRNVEAGDMTTLQEYLDSEGIEMTRGEKHKLARIVSDKYRDRYQSSPRVITRPDTRGRYRLKSSGFTSEHFPLIRECILHIESNYQNPTS